MPSRFHALTVATVVRVRDPNVTYPYCIECYSKLLIDCHSRIWRCLRCKINYNTCNIPQRYRLCLEIADGSALCGATVFGKNLEPYFGGPAEEIHYLLRSYDSNYIMNLLNSFFTGKSFLFGFKTLHPLEKSDFNMSLLSVLKSSCRKHCQSLPTDLIATQMIICNIGMACTIKILLTRNNFKTQNTPPAFIEPLPQTPIILAPTKSPLFIEQTNSGSILPLISQELIVLSYEMNPSGTQTSRNLSDMLISSSGESKTPNCINSCSQGSPPFHAMKSHSTQIYKSFILNSFPDLSARNVSNHLLHSYKKVPSGSHSSVKHLQEVSLADNPSQRILSYGSNCEDVFLQMNNSSDMEHQYSLGVPIPQKEYSMECSLIVNNNDNNVFYAPDSEDLEAFLNSFSNSTHEHFAAFHENTELSQMHTTKANERQMCLLDGYNFKTTLKATSCSKSSLKTFTIAAVNKIRSEDTCKYPTETGDWKTRKINILSLLSFHSSTVTYFLLNLSVPYRFLKCTWESNCLVSNNLKYKNMDKSNRSNLSISDLTCHSKLIMHNYKRNSWSEVNQFCDIRNKIVTQQSVTVNDDKRFVTVNDDKRFITVNDDKHLLISADLYLSSNPAKIVTRTTIDNENISNVYSKYPIKISSTNEYLSKAQSAQRCLSAVNVIKESSPKLSPSNSICNIFPRNTSNIIDMSNIPHDPCINVSVISSLHISNISTSASFKHISPFEETIRPVRCLFKRLPNQDSSLENEPSFLNQFKKRKKCNPCHSYLPRCLCNDFSESKENISYNGGKEVLCFSKELDNVSLSESKQFVNKTLQPRNKNHHSVPTKGSTFRKRQLSNLPFSDDFHSSSTNVNLRKCHSLTSTPVPHFHIYQKSYRNLPYKDSSAEENIEHLFPITPIKFSSENQKQSCPNSPSIFSVESHNSESHVLLPTECLQQNLQEEGNMSQDLYDPSTELFLSSPNPDVILPINTSEDLFSCSWKSPNQFIPQSPNSTPVSVRNICFKRKNGINNMSNQQNSKNSKFSLSKCLLKRQIFKKINNFNQFQARYQMKKLSPSNTMPKTISVPPSPLNRKNQTFIDPSEEILETYANLKPLFSPRILSQNEFNSPRTMNCIESKEISRCNSLIIPDTMGNSFPIMEQSHESEQFSKSILESQDLFSPQILSATQNKTKHLFPLQNLNTISIDNPFHSRFKSKTDVNQQQSPFPKVLQETPCDITSEFLDSEILPETNNESNQNTTNANCKIQNNSHLHQRTPVLCDKTLDIYASPDLFCTQPADSNVQSYPSERFCHIYQNVQTLPQSPDMFTSNTSVQSDTPNILPETQPDGDDCIQTPGIHNEIETNSCNLLLSPDIFSPTQKSKLKYLRQSIGPLRHTPETTKHCISSPDIFFETQKNTQDHMKSPDIFSQTQESFFKHRIKYLYSWNQVSSPTKTTDL